MFGKKIDPKKAPVAPAVPVNNTVDLIVTKPETVGMPGFTEDKPVEAPKPAPVEAPKPVPVEAPKPVEAPAKPAEKYQIVGVEIAAEGLFVYKIVTNKNLGELGGVYEI